MTKLWLTSLHSSERMPSVYYTQTLLDKSISFPYATFKELLVNYVKCTNFSSMKKQNFKKWNIKNSTLLDRPNPMHTKSHPDINSSRSCKAGYWGEHGFGKCLTNDKFHLRNSCVFRHAKCFKFGNMGHIKSVCRATVHFATSDYKLRSSYFIKLGVSSDRLSLSTISEGNVHSQKQLYTLLGSFHNFIVDTSS